MRVYVSVCCVRVLCVWCAYLLWIDRWPRIGGGVGGELAWSEIETIYTTHTHTHLCGGCASHVPRHVAPTSRRYAHAQADQLIYCTRQPTSSWSFDWNAAFSSFFSSLLECGICFRWHLVPQLWSFWNRRSCTGLFCFLCCPPFRIIESR